MKKWHSVHTVPIISLVGLVLLAGCGNAGGGAAAATATATPIPTVSPTPTQQPLTFFQDPLTPPDTLAWQDSGACQFQSDGYHISDAAVCLAPDPVPIFDNGSVSVQVKQVKGVLTQGYGLIFRANPTGGSSGLDFYGFLIDSNGKWRALKYVGGQPTFFEPDFTANAAIHTGLNTSNTITVAMTGTHFDFIVNGTTVGRVDDNAVSLGHAGLWGGHGVEVVYTNFQVKIAT